MILKVLRLIFKNLNIEKVEENVLKDKKLPEQKKKFLEEDFRENKLVSEKDIYYGKMLKVNNDNNSRKYTYFCKFCCRQFVKKESLLNHMNKTCKLKKDKEISNLELQKLQTEDDQQSKISFIEEKGNKMKLDEMMYETDVSHPFKNGDSDDSDDDISDPSVFESNSYGNIGANNIPPNPNLVNPDNNNYPNELPEIKDDEKEDYEEFQKLMYIAGLQGMNEEEQMYFVYQYQRKKDRKN